MLDHQSKSAATETLAEGEGSERAGVAERMAERAARVHILTGAVCNNNCVFCMEEDREQRYVTNSQTTDETVRWILGQHEQFEEVCFTSGEPTTNPRLHHWVKMAKQAGARRISMMTNGRALSHEQYAKRLMALGMNRFYISIHGHTKKLHEGLTRTPGCFEQTVGGLDTIARFKRYGIELHTSTVITKRNLPHMGEIYRFLRSHGVDEVVFNVMQANGRADTYFDLIFPTYVEIAAVARAFFAEQSQREAEVSAVLVDIPLCTTEGIPDPNRGYVENYVHYEHEDTHGLLSEEILGQRAGGASGELVQIRRGDLDDNARHKREACRGCKYDAVCEGVWGNYLRRRGWDEFEPVPA
ncbi:radical SAM protein [Pseudenhygromyxa sp. WMMC2535]|uniref:radical SAM protein HxsC4 n=1 Tax=Pseudenhygromyxa sp. WMMC2535 TaxID=2712867 RepID=UPI0015961B67|nr:radical SAM protein HxsC4 [Pseudenhygromyxa sp. WMMC2535]NVB36979.1 radical SAM protein [Pseudenhygromyxa sp. WMMC2535]